MNFSFNWADYFLGLRIPSLSNSILNRIEFLDDNEHLSGLDLIIGSLYANNILINRIKNECEQY
ncbi:hypothetical protein D917_10146, partial [Trichinella nativa]